MVLAMDKQGKLFISHTDKNKQSEMMKNFKVDNHHFNFVMSSAEKIIIKDFISTAEEVKKQLGL